MHGLGVRAMTRVYSAPNGRLNNQEKRKYLDLRDSLWPLAFFPFIVQVSECRLYYRLVYCTVMIREGIDTITYNTRELPQLLAVTMSE